MANYDPNDPRRTDATDPHRPVDPSGRSTVVTETYVEPVEKKASPLPLIIGILCGVAMNLLTRAGLVMPQGFWAAVDMMARAALPAALGTARALTGATATADADASPFPASGPLPSPPPSSPR